MGRCCFCENAQFCSSLLGGGSQKAVFLFPGGTGGKATQQLAQEDVITVQRIAYQMFK